LSIYHPWKDQCDTCVGHASGNVPDDEWIAHVARKDQARNSKQHDKEQAKEHNSTTLVCCMDLQAVLLAPYLKASALYYKTKLAVHNFTIFNLATGHVVCYVWHEGEGGLCANEFASCVHDYLMEHRSHYESFILYSDGCTYQNRNVTMSKTLLSFAKKYNKVVEQKYLEKGHTQMEVDSAHAVIERKLRNVDIYVPADYVRIMKSARKFPGPYEVKYVEHAFFKNFDDAERISSIRPGRRSGDPTVTNLRCIRYSTSGMQYKLNYDDQWCDMPSKRADRNIAASYDLTPLHPQSLPIKQSKYQHLQQLKAVMPSDYHMFYDQLKKE
jgi:hypothetical protein